MKLEKSGEELKERINLVWYLKINFSLLQHFCGVFEDKMSRENLNWISVTFMKCYFRENSLFLFLFHFTRNLMIGFFNNCISCNSVLQKWSHNFMVLIPLAPFHSETGNWWRNCKEGFTAFKPVSSVMISFLPPTLFLPIIPWWNGSES